MNRPTIVLATTLALFLQTAWGAATLPEEVRAKEFSLGKNGLALGGYDPVSYFNGAPAKGDKSVTTVYRGVLYRFSSSENRDVFLEEPARHEPQYGGWCAWAMYDGGGRTKINPESFAIVDDRLYVFYDGIFGDTLARWNERAAEEDEGAMIDTADRNWAAQF